MFHFFFEYNYIVSHNNCIFLQIFLIQNRNHHYIVETHSDFLIDRFRLNIKKTGHPLDATVVFFERTPSGNNAHSLEINEKGQYPEDQPKGFRDFFIREELRLLEL